jgi:hypothetical protein
LSRPSRVRGREGVIASRTVRHASGESHSHVQHITALIALQADSEETGLIGKSATEKSDDLKGKLKEDSKR